MKIDITSGAAIAAAAAALLIAGTAVSKPQLAADDAKGHCMGANACKGQGEEGNVQSPTRPAKRPG